MGVKGELKSAEDNFPVCYNYNKFSKMHCVFTNTACVQLILPCYYIFFSYNFLLVTIATCNASGEKCTSKLAQLTTGGWMGLIFVWS